MIASKNFLRIVLFACFEDIFCVKPLLTWIINTWEDNFLVKNWDIFQKFSIERSNSSSDMSFFINSIKCFLSDVFVGHYASKLSQKEKNGYM